MTLLRMDESTELSAALPTTFSQRKARDSLGIQQESGAQPVSLGFCSGHLAEKLVDRK